MSSRDALQLALEIFRSPVQVRSVQKSPLPKEVLQVIRIAAGDKLDENALAKSFGWKESEVRAAAVFFLQQILFEKNSSPARILGLSPDANLEDLKNHKRALLKWLHPDRNANKWENVLLQRVITASNSVANTLERNEDSRTSERMNAEKPPVLSRPKRRQHPRKSIGVKRFQKSIALRVHLLSFLKRASFLIVAVAVVLLGLDAFAIPDVSQQLFIFASNMFTKID